MNFIKSKKLNVLLILVVFSLVTGCGKSKENESHGTSNNNPIDQIMNTIGDGIVTSIAEVVEASFIIGISATRCMMTSMTASVTREMVDSIEHDYQVSLSEKQIEELVIIVKENDVSNYSDFSNYLPEDDFNELDQTLQVAYDNSSDELIDIEYFKDLFFGYIRSISSKEDFNLSELFPARVLGEVQLEDEDFIRVIKAQFEIDNLPNDEIKNRLYICTI